MVGGTSERQSWAMWSGSPGRRDWWWSSEVLWRLTADFVVVVVVVGEVCMGVVVVIGCGDRERKGDRGVGF